MAISSKHHYIPQFFLNGFTNDQGEFYIYDKQRDQIKSKSFPPSTHFFEKDRNTIVMDGQADDTPEQLFGLFENREKVIVKFIQEQKGIPQLSMQQMVDLQIFLSNLFFRLPVLDSTFKRYMEDTSFPLRELKVKNRISGEAAPPELMEKLRMDPSFQRMYRPAIGSMVLLRSNSIEDHENWGFSLRSDSNNLLSDNPLIFDDLRTLDFFENSFVMPMTGRHKLIRVKKKISKTQLSPKFALMSEVLMIHQAKQFVCCASRAVLEQMVSASKVFDIELCRKAVFEELRQ
ncbi:DUF4238 domain-containing protein [Pedobacter panaciterrae]|uniref:DUF4238 domain-containing protein n=1 Tax=Pedobacter panaciterrae TaxID=363849 RepID=UPI00155DBB07|nr:DUF4238 domain-containing protein [Pedobacter panaciterrae]NQX53662.1 DUF4238 domain-containing protein [Pedobacter panaciterrae]